MGVVVRGWWLIDPADGVPHAWHKVVDGGGLWLSRCEDATADPAGLLNPADDSGRCEKCTLILMVELGTQLADRQDAKRTATRGKLRIELRPSLP